MEKTSREVGMLVEFFWEGGGISGEVEERKDKWR